LQAYGAEQLVYVDEAGVDDTEDYAYGWCAQSERFEALKLGHRTERISMIAAWCNRQVVAPLTFKGYCDTALVETWVEQYLVGQLKPGQVVVMDNASFHKSTLIRELIEQAGCSLLFLPPYSPDLNKIEKFWARLKHYLRKTLNQFENLWDAVDNAFRRLS
jgi:transposase